MSARPGDPSEPFPTAPSAGVAVLAILGACFAGLTAPIQIGPLLLEAAGITLFVGGILLRRRDRRFLGKALTGAGAIVVSASLVGIVALSPPLATLVPLLLCAVGVFGVAVGMFPVFAGLTGPLSITGVGFVFVGVTSNAVFGSPPFWRSTVAVTLVFLSWDASVRAITLGELVGGTADTISVEKAGASASTVVAAMAVVLTIAVSRIPIDRSSLVGLALLLVAALAFTLALAHVPAAPEPRR